VVPSNALVEFGNDAVHKMNRPKWKWKKEGRLEVNVVT
jgi:hypothetical protein